jgi:hypothetical protein
MNVDPKLIHAYREQFGEEPPIFEMDEALAIERINLALEKGEPMEDPADNLPEDALI